MIVDKKAEKDFLINSNIFWVLDPKEERELLFFLRLEKGDKVVMIDNNQVHYYGIINDEPPKKAPKHYPFISTLRREIKWINKPYWCPPIQQIITTSISYVPDKS